MLVTQVIPGVVRQAVSQAQLVNLAKSIIDRNADIKDARDSVKRQQNIPLDQAAFQVVNRNPDVKQLIREESWDLV